MNCPPKPYVLAVLLRLSADYARKANKNIAVYGLPTALYCIERKTT